MSSVIKKALLSEKSYYLASNGKYTFIVDPRAEKELISSEIEKLFKVHVVSLNSANYKGKIKQSRKNRGKRSDFKKVIVTLRKNEKIDLFEIEEKDKKTDKQVKSKATKTKDR